MTVFNRISGACRRWRIALARELLRDQETVILHRDGDLSAGAIYRDARGG